MHWVLMAQSLLSVRFLHVAYLDFPCYSIPSNLVFCTEFSHLPIPLRCSPWFRRFSYSILSFNYLVARGDWLDIGVFRLRPPHYPASYLPNAYQRNGSSIWRPTTNFFRDRIRPFLLIQSHFASLGIHFHLPISQYIICYGDPHRWPR